MPRAKKTIGLRAYITSIFFIILLSYFVFHAISGERGLLALLQLSQKVEQTRTEFDETRAEKLTLENRVKLLKTDSLDLDMLDEQARRQLGYIKNDEVIYEIKDDTSK